MFDRLGVGVVEFFYAPGVKTSVDDDFLLVGDVQHRPYTDLLRTDLRESVSGKGTSAYVRIPFHVSDVTAVETMSLWTKFDDGFAVFLNGGEIARYAAPAELNYASAATDSRYDSDALRPDVVDVTQHRGLFAKERTSWRSTL